MVSPTKQREYDCEAVRQTELTPEERNMVQKAQAVLARETKAKAKPRSAVFNARGALLPCGSWLLEEYCRECDFCPKKTKDTARSLALHYHNVHNYTVLRRHMPQWSWVTPEMKLPDAEYDAFAYFCRSSDRKTRLTAERARAALEFTTAKQAGELRKGAKIDEYLREVGHSLRQTTFIDEWHALSEVHRRLWQERWEKSRTSTRTGANRLRKEDDVRGDSEPLHEDRPESEEDYEQGSEEDYDLADYPQDIAPPSALDRQRPSASHGQRPSAPDRPRSSAPDEAGQARSPRPPSHVTARAVVSAKRRREEGEDGVEPMSNRDHRLLAFEKAPRLDREDTLPALQRSRAIEEKNKACAEANDTTDPADQAPRKKRMVRPTPADDASHNPVHAASDTSSGGSTSSPVSLDTSISEKDFDENVDYPDTGISPNSTASPTLSIPAPECNAHIVDCLGSVESKLTGMETLAEWRHQDLLSEIRQVSQHQNRAAASNINAEPLAPAPPAPKLAFDEIFAWVSKDTVRKFKDGDFTIDDFLKLRNPYSVVCCPPSKRKRIVLNQDGTLEAEEDLDDLVRFMKAVPSLGALLQLWSTYTALAVFYSHEPKDLSTALNKVAQQLTEIEAVYTWENICSYFFALCSSRFNRANAQEWAQRDVVIYQDYLWDRK